MFDYNATWGIVSRGRVIAYKPFFDAKWGGHIDFDTNFHEKWELPLKLCGILWSFPAELLKCNYPTYPPAPSLKGRGARYNQVYRAEGRSSSIGKVERALYKISEQ